MLKKQIQKLQQLIDSKRLSLDDKRKVSKVIINCKKINERK